MEYKNIHIVYFSPTHTSAKTAYAIAEGLGSHFIWVMSYSPSPPRICEVIGATMASILESSGFG